MYAGSKCVECRLSKESSPLQVLQAALPAEQLWQHAKARGKLAPDLCILVSCQSCQRGM